MRGAFVYAVAGSLCAGLALGVLGFGAAPAAACLAVAFGLLCFARTKPLGLIAAAALAAAALGIARADFFLYRQAQEGLANYADAAVVIDGEVVSDPERRATSLHAHVRAERINGREATGVALVVLPRETEMSYGERVRVRGVLQAPQAFETNGGRLFDYPGYLRVQGVSAVMQRAQVQSQTPAGFSVQGYLYALKHAFARSLESLFPEPDNALLQGILFGERAGLPKELNDAFIRSSLVHVVVLSGYNISIVSLAVLAALSFLPQTVALSLGGFSMILFVSMVGAGAATVRALIMALIALLARYLNRPSIAMRSLAVAAAAMALWNPLELFSDSSFVLSVLATFGLIALSPAVERRLRFVPERFGMRSIAASTIAVQIFVLPALLYYTGTLSLVALPANMLALPVVSYAMGFGFLAGMLGLFHAALGLAPAFVADALLRWMMLVANTSASIPFGSLIIPAFPVWLAMAAYAPLLYIALRAYQKEVREARRDG